MKIYIITATLALMPVVVLADRPEGGVINDIKSEIRDDYRQLHEDQAAGLTEDVREDERQLAEDKLRLRSAQHEPIKARHHPENIKPAAGGDQVLAAPPKEENDELRDPFYSGSGEKMDPDKTFNHAAHVDNEIR